MEYGFLSLNRLYKKKRIDCNRRNAPRDRLHRRTRNKNDEKKSKQITCGRLRLGHLKLHETHRGRCVIKSLRQTCLSLHLMLLQLAASETTERKKTKMYILIWKKKEKRNEVAPPKTHAISVFLWPRPASRGQCQYDDDMHEIRDRSNATEKNKNRTRTYTKYKKPDKVIWHVTKSTEEPTTTEHRRLFLLKISFRTSRIRDITFLYRIWPERARHITRRNFYQIKAGRRYRNAFLVCDLQRVAHATNEEIASNEDQCQCNAGEKAPSASVVANRGK